jgi:hypothetical protein
MVAKARNDDITSPMKRARTMKHLHNVQKISRCKRLTLLSLLSCCDKVYSISHLNLSIFLIVLIAILHSITNDQRSQAFITAQKAFDHKVETMHDIEVQEGIVSSLCLQLGYILNKGSSGGMDIASIYSIIAMVYQCSDQVRANSFIHVGKDLLQMIYSSFASVRNTEYFGWCTYHIMKVMRALSRLREASVAMVHQEESLTILQIVILDKEANLGAKLEAVATLKNITFYAEDFRLGVMHHPGLLDALIRTCTDRGDDTGREFASAVIRNIAMAPDTKIPMVEHSCLLDVLVGLMDDQNLKTRRNAVSAIGSLAIADENSMIFVTHGEGIILKMMQRLVEEEDDSVIRRRAARALRCFGRKDTVELIVNRKGIVESLCGVAMNDPSVEAKIEAIEALATFVSHAHAVAPYYQNILDAIINIANSSPPPSCIETLAKTMNVLSCIEHHRQPMVDHNDLLRTLVLIASDPSSTGTCREQCVSAIYNLTCDEENREKMTSKHVLVLLIAILGNHEYLGERLSQTYAVKAIINLAAFEKNRKCLAHEKGLINCLIKFATESQNSEIKDAVKATIMSLVPLI